MDVRINKTQKRVEVDLRVELTDGGALGFNRQPYRNEMDDPRLPHYEDRYDWDRVPPAQVAASGIAPYRTRNRSFADLERLALSGLAYHWSRNANHQEAKAVTISAEPFQVFVNTVNTAETAMDDVALICNTNGPWLRSGNPGTVEDPISFFGNVFSREAVAYNVGYIGESND